MNETINIWISSDNKKPVVLLIIFKENTITEPKEIVEIRNSTEDTRSDDLKIKIFLSSNFSL
jgi:hypothetical protein